MPQFRVKAVPKQDIWAGRSEEDKAAYSQFIEQFTRAGSLFAILMLEREKEYPTFKSTQVGHVVKGIDVNQLLRDVQVLGAHYIHQNIPVLYEGLAALETGKPGVVAFKGLPVGDINNFPTPSEIRLNKTLRSATAGDYIVAPASLIAGKTIGGVPLQNYYDVIDKRGDEKVLRREIHTDPLEEYFMLFCNRPSNRDKQAITVFNDMIAAFEQLISREQELLQQPIFKAEGFPGGILKESATPLIAPITIGENGLPELHTKAKITYLTESENPEAQAAFLKWRDTARSPDFSSAIVLKPGDMVAVSTKRFAHSVQRLAIAPEKQTNTHEVVLNASREETITEPRWLVRIGGHTFGMKQEGEFFPSPRGIDMEKTLEALRVLNSEVEKQRDAIKR